MAYNCDIKAEVGDIVTINYDARFFMSGTQIGDFARINIVGDCGDGRCAITLLKNSETQLAYDKHLKFFGRVGCTIPKQKERVFRGRTFKDR